MNTPVNPFKQALLQPGAQIGLWLSLANPYTAEMCAGAGFDWLLIDGEHSPNDPRSLLGQLQAIDAGGTSQAVARIPVGDSTLIKQYLDLGARNLLVPMVESADQARALVRATRYAPAGIRGMAGARASRWGRYTDYFKAANDQICLLLQIESVEGLEQLEAIANVDGVDGVFIGPADLSASMGYPGQANHPDVAATIEKALARIVACGKAPGILTLDPALANRYIELGARFVAVGLDTTLLMRGLAALAGQFGLAPGGRPDKGGVYS